MKNVPTIILIMLFGCQRAPSSQLDSDHFIPEPNKEYLLFMNYNLSMVENEAEATFANLFISEGRLKQPLPQKAKEFPALMLEIVGNKDEKLDKIYLDNPLVKHTEYVDENGALAKKVIKTNEAELVIRVQLPPETQEVILWYLPNPNEQRELHRKLI